MQVTEVKPKKRVKRDFIRTRSHTDRDGRLCVDIGMRITNPLNSSWGRWQVRAGERKRQRAKFAIAVADATPPLLVREITFIRYAPRPLDSDGLQAAFKSFRDEACVWLGAADDSARSGLAFKYEQYQQHEYGVRVRFA